VLQAQVLTKVKTAIFKAWQSNSFFPFIVSVLKQEDIGVKIVENE